MAKMRGIKPDIWTDEKFVSVSPLARLLFIGMWHNACDNGHVDSSEMQLKMRILPMDNCNISELISSLINIGLVTRQPNCLKVPNIPIHQNIDRRYLLLCDHCAHDVGATFTEADRLGRNGKPIEHPSGAQRVPTVRTSCARVKEGSEGTEGEGEVKGSEGEGSTSSSEVADAPTRPDVDQLLDLLDAEIRANGAKTPSRTIGNHNAIRLLIDRDKRPIDEIGETIRWCQADEFWRSNILSASKLREKYDQLRGQMRRPSRQLSAVPNRTWTPPPGSPLSYVEM